MKTKKFVETMDIKKGDTIKKYDRAYVNDSYSIGLVTKVVDDTIFFSCTERVIDGKPVQISKKKQTAVFFQRLAVWK